MSMIKQRAYLAVNDFKQNIYLYISIVLVIFLGCAAGYSYYLNLPPGEQNNISNIILWVIQNNRIGEFNSLAMFLSGLLPLAILFLSIALCSLHFVSFPVLAAAVFIKGFYFGFMFSGIIFLGNILSTIVIIFAELLPKGLILLLVLKACSASFLNCIKLFKKRKIITSFKIRLRISSPCYIIIAKCAVFAACALLFETVISVLIFKLA